MIDIQQAQQSAAPEEYRNAVNAILYDRGHPPAWDDAIENCYAAGRNPQAAAEAIILVSAWAARAAA